MSFPKAMKKFEYRFDLKAEAFIWHHPLLGFFFVFVGMPLFVLLAVCICTVAIAFPVAWIFGWL